MGKKASARIKNRVKAHFARSISSLEKTVGKERSFETTPRHKKMK
jgi:hypothetical protein